MDTPQPKTRKGPDGKKKDQRMKAQNDSIFGSKKHVRLKEKMMEQKMMEHNIGKNYIEKLSTNSKLQSKKKNKKHS